ncbi:MAG TPA: cytochrome c oxidase subunit II [Chthoniobacteraceae bacterium]|jgi:cytochrome c oxidase subunit 2|nr:cytochrome c oxidase subunit II [Chthoniobacteraceae bacterium]
MLNRLSGILPNASEHGPMVDHMLEFCHWFMLVLFVGWTTYFLFAIWRFHKSRNPKADYHGVRSHASTHLEASVVLIEAVLLLGFALPLWGRRVTEFPVTGDRLEVRCIGYQFGWDFHYPGLDGKFGKQGVGFINSSNPLGIDPNDPAGRDDFWSKDLHLINHKPTVVRVSSRDVIHGLALHQMRIQQDAMPGMEIPQWFRPIKTGTWEIICAQLCGVGHSAMRATYTVEEQKEFDQFQKDQLDLRGANTAPAAPTVAPPAPAPGVQPQ